MLSVYSVLLIKAVCSFETLKLVNAVLPVLISSSVLASSLYLVLPHLKKGLTFSLWHSASVVTVTASKEGEVCGHLSKHKQPKAEES